VRRELRDRFGAAADGRIGKVVRAVRNGTAAAIRTDRSVARTGRSLAAAGRAAERAGDGLDRLLRDLRRRAKEQVEMTRQLLERIRRPGPDRDSGPSR